MKNFILQQQRAVGEMDWENGCQHTTQAINKLKTDYPSGNTPEHDSPEYVTRQNEICQTQYNFLEAIGLPIPEDRQLYTTTTDDHRSCAE
jgi:hypothetical protein